MEKLRETLEKLSDQDLNDLVDALKPEDIIEFARGAKLSMLSESANEKTKTNSHSKTPTLIGSAISFLFNYKILSSF